MTRDDIIRMAREADLSHFYDSEGHCSGITDEQLVTKDKQRNDDRLVHMLAPFAALVAAAEREACAELVWPSRQIKHWSEEELTDMTGAFNRAQEKHGWYETIMAVGAAALKGRAAAIRARGQE